MSSVVLSGDSSGSVTLTVPSAAGSNTVTIPAATGTALTDATVGVCRAWVKFGGGLSPSSAGTIYGSFNVSSITVNGTGDYSVNYTNAISDTNYAFVVTGSDDVNDSGNASRIWVQNRVTTTAKGRVNTLSAAGSLTNAVYISVAVFR